MENEKITKLYIIGNGFDIAHNLQTRYSDFKNYTKKNNRDLYDKLNSIYDEYELWNDFEQALGNPNMEELSQIDKLFGTKNVIGEIFARCIKEELNSWIRSIDYTNTERKFKLQDNSLFLSFNYTDTLGYVYKIDTNRIKYIHGFVADSLYGNELVIGHHNSEFNNNELVESTYKDSKEIIKENKNWFDRIKSSLIDEIEVIGHSYNDIDIDYFKKIKTIKPDAKWILNTYSDKDVQHARDYIEKLNIKKYLIKS